MPPTSDEPTFPPIRATVPRALAEWAGRHSADGLVVLVVTVDRVEAVGDVLGAEAAQALNGVVLDRLGEWAGPDGRAAALDGAGFVAVLAGHADPTAAASRLSALVAQPVRVAGLVVSRSASIGMAVDPGRRLPLDTLVTRAGRACARVRTAGGDGIALFDPALDAERAEGMRLDLELHEALTAGQLRLHYQPEFDLGTGEVLGAEALLRWQHPRRGLLRAGAFIESVEPTRTFSAVQRWVFEECCRRLAAWTSTPLGGLLLRTNVTGARLEQPTTVDGLLAALDRHGVAARRLCVEVTESRMPADLETLTAQIRRLRAAGASVALDDYGTGQSTTTHLRVMPVDTVKLDRSFVIGMRTDDRTGRIVAALIGIARALDLDVVAEGVDGPETAAELLRLGCRRGQGDALGPAAPEERLAALVSRPGRHAAGN